MRPPTVIQAAQNALSAIGGRWRADWSDFDGRTLRDQLNEVSGALGVAELGDEPRAIQQLTAIAERETERMDA